jgi:hypothetical protein
MHINTKTKKFMKTNPTKVVAAFDQVLGHCNALGAKYNPCKESMNITALTNLLTSAEVTVQAVNNAKSNLIQAVNNRQTVFATVPSVGTRILNALIAMDASPQLIADVRLYRDKFRSVSRKKTAKPEDSSTTNTHADASRGPVSYLDFESKINNLGIIIDLLKTEPMYQPNEVDITIAGLTSLLATLREKNKAVRDAQVLARNARVARNATLYSEAGVIGTARRVKKYFLSVFGATSEQFQSVNKIKMWS